MDLQCWQVFQEKILHAITSSQTSIGSWTTDVSLWDWGSEPFFSHPFSLSLKRKNRAQTMCFFCWFVINFNHWTLTGVFINKSRSQKQRLEDVQQELPKYWCMPKPFSIKHHLCRKHTMDGSFACINNSVCWTYLCVLVTVSDGQSIPLHVFKREEH